jgi:hypothetical protein
VDPTGAVLLKAIKDAGGDLAHLTESAQAISLAGDPGIGLLFAWRNNYTRSNQREGGMAPRHGHPL